MNVKAFFPWMDGIWRYRYRSTATKLHHDINTIRWVWIRETESRHNNPAVHSPRFYKHLICKDGHVFMKGQQGQSQTGTDGAMQVVPLVHWVTPILGTPLSPLPNICVPKNLDSSIMETNHWWRGVQCKWLDCRLKWYTAYSTYYFLHLYSWI